MPYGKRQPLSGWHSSSLIPTHTHTGEISPYSEDSSSTRVFLVQVNLKAASTVSVGQSAMLKELHLAGRSWWVFIPYNGKCTVMRMSPQVMARRAAQGREAAAQSIVIRCS